ncbi:hypothetical protein BH09MYX1_BH09MYX1_45920 [soil metagenome]
MKRFALLFALALALASTGCASVYTGIQREADGSYYLTRTKQGPFSAYGTLYRCQVVSAQSMRCAEIDTP